MEKYKILVGYYGVELQQLEEQMNEYGAKGYKISHFSTSKFKITIIMENTNDVHILDNNIEYDFPFEVEENLVTSASHVGGDPEDEVE